MSAFDSPNHSLFCGYLAGIFFMDSKREGGVATEFEIVMDDDGYTNVFIAIQGESRFKITVEEVLDPAVHEARLALEKSVIELSR